MEEQKFIKDEYDEITGVENEETITYKIFPRYSDFNEGLKVLVTDEGEYYNVYIIDSKFKKEPMNCLKLQEPKADLKKFEDFNENKLEEYFNEMRLECWAVEHYLWAKYGNPDAQTCISFGVDYEINKFDWAFNFLGYFEKDRTK